MHTLFFRDEVPEAFKDYYAKDKEGDCPCGTYGNIEVEIPAEDASVIDWWRGDAGVCEILRFKDGSLWRNYHGCAEIRGYCHRVKEWTCTTPAK